MPKYVFNPITLEYEAHEVPRWHRTARIAVAVAAVAALSWLYFWLYTSVLGFDLPKTARLKREAAAWQTRMEVANRRLDLFETTLEGIEERNDRVYRSIYGLGGATRYDFLDEVGANPLLKSTLRRGDNLTRRAWLQSLSLDEVQVISLNAGDMISHIPSIPPIVPDKGTFHLASPFGYRTDPVYGGTRFHEGQDLATQKGTPVYAPGDGVVVLTEFKFTGYGNEIVIDHGFGYKTRYAHLSRIDVVQGMTVRRGDLIGAVGTTGKSTGPHLHYEVLYMGARVNPRNYMNLDMPVDEYRAMVESRRQESAPKQKSSLELLTGRRQ